jgi:dynein heavy chain 1
MKREELIKLTTTLTEEKEIRDFEEKILLRSVCETIVPKLIADDVPLL